MRIAVVAMSVGGAMGQYLHAWLPELGKVHEISLVAPSHYEFAPANYRLATFAVPKAKWQRLFAICHVHTARRIYQTLARLKPEAVHLFNGEGYPSSLHLSRLMSGREPLPFVTTIHDYSPHSKDLVGLISSVLRKAVLRRSASLHVHTEMARDRILRSGRHGQPVHVIPHGNLAPLYTPYLRPGIPKENAALFFGRLEYYKGVDLAVGALRLLPADFRLIIAGPGKLSRSLKGLIKEFPGRVELHNEYVPPAEVARLFQRARVCVLPYRDATQSSVPALSASLGVPVVASATGGLIEDVPRVDGILVPCPNPASLAAAIAAALGRKPKVPEELDFSRLAGDFAAMYAQGAQAASLPPTGPAFAGVPNELR